MKKRRVTLNEPGESGVIYFFLWAQKNVLIALKLQPHQLSCNLFFFTDKSLPAIALPIGEGRENLWGKTREAYRYVWENYKDQADWFMKADDDT